MRRTRWMGFLTALLGACAEETAGPAGDAVSGNADALARVYSPAAAGAPAAGFPAAGAAANGGVDLCPDGFARGTLARSPRKIANMAPSPEGVTVCSGGDIFVARDPSGEVWRVQLDGQQELWASLGDRRPAGIACDDQGRLFVATFATKSGKEGSLAPVLITDQGATPIELPQPTAAAKIAGLNGIVAVPGVGVYTSDTNNSNILLVSESADGKFETRVVARDVALANGLAYAPATRSLYANASGAWELLQYKVGEDGALSERKSVPVPFMFFMDGVAVDEKGDLYVADWLAGNVVHVSTRRSVLRITNPASLAFRGGTLLVTDYKLGDAQAEGGLFAIDLGVCGPS